jgi:hypothetical protein
MKLLHVDSSILGQNSASRELSAAIVARWQEAVPGLQITYRDLDAAPLPHLSCASLTQGNVTETADAGRALQDFLDADVIDHLAVAGKTFHYTETGPKGLLAGKQVIVAAAAAASTRTAVAISRKPICATFSASSASPMSKSSAPKAWRRRRSIGPTAWPPHTRRSGHHWPQRRNPPPAKERPAQAGPLHTYCSRIRQYVRRRPCTTATLRAR